MNQTRNKLPSNDPSSYCRFCFSDSNLVPLFPSGEPPRHILLDLITDLVGIQIDNGADTSCSICWRCAVALEDFQLFRQRSCEHDAIVRENLVPFGGQGKFEEREYVSSSFETPEETQQDNDTSLLRFVQSLNHSNEYAENSTNAHNDINRTSLEHEFICPLCYVSYRFHTNLQKHFEKHHPELVTGATITPANNPNQRKRTSLGQLRAYQNPPPLPPSSQATSDNLFKCSYCPKSFKHGPSLHFHLKSHYDMLPFVCEFCDARFINEKGKHIHKGRYHYENGVRKPAPPRETFECKECNRSFVHRKYLWQHIRYKHPERCLPDGSDPTLVMLPPTEMPNHEETFENHADDEPLLEIKSEIDDSDSYCPLWD
uniref:Fez family zinc finger protein 2 n=1 Tax=Culex pipiens TaxID=7175 RepID=A0A8D8D6P8_CULPI